MGAAVGRPLLLRRRPHDDARQPRLRGLIAIEEAGGKIATLVEVMPFLPFLELIVYVYDHLVPNQSV